MFACVILGTSREGLAVLQKFLDLSGDIQSVCMLAMRAFAPDLVQEQLVHDWLEA